VLRGGAETLRTTGPHGKLSVESVDAAKEDETIETDGGDGQNGKESLFLKGKEFQTS